MHRYSTLNVWYVYLVECADGSLYCGISQDVAARIAKHNAGKGAKYTSGRRPVTLLGTSAGMTRGDAARLEHRVKQLPKHLKLATVRGEVA